MGKNEYGESGQLSIFTLLKHLMMLLKYNFQGLIFTPYTPVTLIRNQQESSRTSRNEEFSKSVPHSGGNFTPSHTRGRMSRNDDGMEILYIILDMRFGGVLNYVRTHSRANRDVPTEFEPHSSRNQKIPTTFELLSS